MLSNPRLIIKSLKIHYLNIPPVDVFVPFLFSSVSEASFEQFRVAEKAHGNWMKLFMEGNTSEVLSNMGKKVLKQYLLALSAMSSALSKELGKYDMYSMIAGMVFVFQVSRFNLRQGKKHSAFLFLFFHLFFLGEGND